MMKEHLEKYHAQNNSVYVLKALTEQTTVVRILAKDIFQIKADSIIINNDVMSNIKGTSLRKLMRMSTISLG